jgi:hypothetical protein
MRSRADQNTIAYSNGVLVLHAGDQMQRGGNLGLSTLRALSAPLTGRPAGSSNPTCISTPTGKMVFTVLGAVAELERSLIAERVKAGLRNARAKGTRLGRPKAGVDAARVADLRRTGASWAKIRAELSLSKRTASARFGRCPKTLPCPQTPPRSLAESLAIRLPKTAL